MKKRSRILKAKPGELRVAWARPDRHNGPDVTYAWGQGCHQGDGSFLHYMFGTDRLEHNYDRPIGVELNRYNMTKYAPSLLKELEARGYDLTTLKFSIQKKKKVPDVGGD